jgi:hypothetical protein
MSFVHAAYCASDPSQGRNTQGGHPMHTGRPRIWGSAWRSSTIGRAPTTPFWTKVPDVVRAAAPPSAATPLRRRPHRLNETIVAWARRIRLILAEIGNRTIDLSQKPRVKLVVAEAYFASAPPLRFSKVCGRRGSESGDGSGSVSGFGERLGLGRRRWRLGRLGHWRAASPLARGRREGTAGLCFTTFFRRPGRCGAPPGSAPPGARRPVGAPAGRIVRNRVAARSGAARPS